MTSIERLKKALSEIESDDYESADREVFRYIETTLMDNGKEGRIGMKLLEIIRKDLMP